MKAACAIILAAFSAVAVKGADIEGVVTFWRSPDPYFFMETASGAVWRVQRDAREPRVSVGDIVSVGGYGIKGIATPRFKADVVRILGHDPEKLPTPERVSLAELLVDPIADTNAVNRYGRIVTVDGIVRDVNRRQTYMQLALGNGFGIVQVVIPYKYERPTPEDLKLGARVRVTRVYVFGATKDIATQTETGIETSSVLALRYLALTRGMA